MIINEQRRLLAPLLEKEKKQLKKTGGTDLFLGCRNDELPKGRWGNGWVPMHCQPERTAVRKKEKPSKGLPLTRRVIGAPSSLGGWGLGGGGRGTYNLVTKH